eukprot:403337033
MEKTDISDNKQLEEGGIEQQDSKQIQVQNKLSEIPNNLEQAKKSYKTYYYQYALVCINCLQIVKKDQQSENDDLQTLLDDLLIMKLQIKCLIKLTNFYKAKLVLQKFTLKLNQVQQKCELGNSQDVEKLIQVYKCFIAVSYEKSGYYNTAYPLLQQIVDENKDLMRSLTSENLLNSLNVDSDKKLFKYQLKVQLSLSKLHGYYFEYKTADNILSQLETSLVNISQEIGAAHKSEVIKVQVKVLNQRAKYYLGLELYEKTEDVIFEIWKHSDLLSDSKKIKYSSWLGVIDTNLKSDKIGEAIEKHQKYFSQINQEAQNLLFVAQKEGVKKNLIINKLHIFNCLQLYPQEGNDMKMLLADNYKKELEILDPTGKDLFISMIFCNYVQFLKHSQFDQDSDQQLETYVFLRDMYKKYSDQLGDNNKFMDMLFYWNQLLIQSISLSPILILQTIDESLIFLNEIAIPFYLNQVKLNKMSLYKIFNVLYYLAINTYNMQNRKANEIISQHYLGLLEKIKSLDKVSDGTLDFFQLCERVSPMLHNILETKEQSAINFREVYDYLTETQKAIADQMFHGQYHNYLNRLLEQEKALIVSMNNSKQIRAIYFRDLPTVDQIVAKEYLQFYKNSFSYFLNSAIMQLIKDQSIQAIQSNQHDFITFYLQELVDYQFKIKDFQTYIQQAIVYMDYLLKNQKHEECIIQAKQFSSNVANHYGLKMIIQIYGLQIALAATDYFYAVSYRALNKLDYSLKHIQSAIDKVTELQKSSQDFSDQAEKTKITYYHILLDCGKFQTQNLSQIIQEINGFKNYSQDKEVKKELTQLKERLGLLKKTETRKFIAKTIGAGVLLQELLSEQQSYLLRRKIIELFYRLCHISQKQQLL